MNVVTSLINSLEEIDYEDLWERSKDAVQANWPTDAGSFENAKEFLRDMILSALNNDWPGKHPHSPNDTYIMFKTEDADTGLLLGLSCGFLSPDGTLNGSQAFSTPDTTGSRNYIYAPETIENRNAFYREVGINKIQYTMIVKNSSYHRLLKLRQSTGNYTIISETEMGDSYITVLTQLNL